MTHENSAGGPYELDMGHFMPPVETTKTAFEATFNKLNTFASSHAVRSVEVGYGSESGLNAVTVYCYESTDTEGGEAASLVQNLLRVFVVQDGVSYSLGNEVAAVEPSLSAALSKTLTHTIDSLPEFEGVWLRMAAHDARLDPLFHSASVSNLLLTAPYAVMEHTTTFVSATFADGTSVQGNTLQDNAAFEEELSTDQAKRALFVTAPEGTEYEYSLLADGTERLLMKRGGGEYREDDFMRHLQAGKAFYHETRSHGLNAPTDYKLRSLTATLDAAIASGPAPTEA